MARKETSDRPSSPEMDKSNDDTAKSIAANYFESTTTHGLSHISTSKSKYIRFIWLCIFLFLSCMLFSNIVNLFRKFFRNDVVTIIKSNSFQSMAFPAVTVCNANPFRRSKMKNLIREIPNGSLDTNYFLTHGNMQFASKIGHLNDTSMYELGHEKEVFLMMGASFCTFSNRPCNFSFDFSLMSALLVGNCYVFNYHGLQKQTRLDKHGGLFMALNILQDDYSSNYYWSRGLAGVDVTVHHPQAIPITSNTIYAGPGMLTDFQLTKTKIKRLKNPYPDDCWDEENFHDIPFFKGRYATDLCQMDCYTMQMIKACGVISPLLHGVVKRFYGENRFKVANTTSQGKCLDAFDRLFDAGKINCPCNAACDEDVYNTVSSTTKWPAKSEAEKLLAAIKKYGRKKDLFANWTTKNIYENIVAINIYFRDFTESEISQKPAYDSTSLVSDFGGQLGLWIGASFISAIEFGTFILRLARYYFCRKKQQESGNNKVVAFRKDFP